MTSIQITTDLRLDANDGTLEELQAAQHNFDRIRGGWCLGHGGEETQDVYFRDVISGRHGWMCSRCRGVTQTG